MKWRVCCEGMVKGSIVKCIVKEGMMKSMIGGYGESVWWLGYGE